MHILVAAIVILLVACSGKSGPGTGTTGADASVDGSASSSGGSDGGSGSGGSQDGGSPDGGDEGGACTGPGQCDTAHPCAGPHARCCPPLDPLQQPCGTCAESVCPG